MAGFKLVWNKWGRSEFSSKRNEKCRRRGKEVVWLGENQVGKREKRGR